VPLELTKRDAKRLTRSRRLLQPPAPGQPLLGALGERRVEGIPLDVLLTLEALRQLGEQGNVIAERIYQHERERLGIDRPLTV
jgi:hypothetical protein